MKIHTMKGIFATGLIFLSACTQVREPEVKLMPTPAGEHTSLSRLTTDTKGIVHLSWVEGTDATHTLYYARLEGDKWGEARQISQGENWFVNWADFPSIAVNDTGMTAHWLQMSGEGTYDYNVIASFFDPQAQHWSDPITVHNDGVSAEHGFVSMLPMQGGRTFITWLDGRNTGSESRGMTLRAGIFSQDSKTLYDWELDDRTCDCCQTSAAITANGPIVAYRDRSDKEVRDIYITRLVADKWSKPIPIFSDDWTINGCPVNGPAIATMDQLAAVVWFSAKDDQPEVKFAISQNNGESFQSPITVVDAGTNGRVGITILDSGNIVISWLDTQDSVAQLQLAMYTTGGELINKVQVANTSASRRSGFPVITSAGNEVFVTWTDISQGAQVKVARVRF